VIAHPDKQFYLWLRGQALRAARIAYIFYKETNDEDFKKLGEKFIEQEKGIKDDSEAHGFL